MFTFLYFFTVMILAIGAWNFSGWLIDAISSLFAPKLPKSVSTIMTADEMKQFSNLHVVADNTGKIHVGADISSKV